MQVLPCNHVFIVCLINASVNYCLFMFNACIINHYCINARVTMFTSITIFTFHFFSRQEFGAVTDGTKGRLPGTMGDLEPSEIGTDDLQFAAVDRLPRFIVLFVLLFIVYVLYVCICACVYIYIYIYNINIYIYIYIPICLSLCVYIYIYIYVCVCVFRFC